MKKLSVLKEYAREHPLLGWGDDDGGYFMVRSATGGCVLRVIASCTDGWDHVSVSPSVPRTPTWAEMSQIHRLFFKEDEVALQLHVPEKEHINVHDYVLHLWRNHAQRIELPPREYV